MSLLRSWTAAKPVVILLISNLLGALVGGAFFLSASSSFDLAEMGRYSVAISVQWIVVGLLGSGLSTAAVRLATGHLRRGDRGAASGVVFAGLVIVSAAAAAAVAALLFVDWILAGAGYLSGRLLALVVAWAAARAMLDVARSGLLAQQRYSRAAGLTAWSAGTGATALLTVWQLGPLTLERLLAAHLAGLGSAAILGVYFLRDLGMPGYAGLRDTWMDLLRYARWPAASEGTRLLQANLGPLILVPLAGSGAAGLFGVARYPAYLFEVVAVSLYQYWLPEAARKGEDGDIAGYLRRQLLLASVIGLAMVLAAVVCRPFLPLLGENFAAAAPLFVLNAVDFAVFLLTRPIESVFHGLRKPQLELWPRLARIPLLAIAAWLFVPAGGAPAMVWAYVITGLVVLGVGSWLVSRELRRR